MLSCSMTARKNVLKTKILGDVTRSLPITYKQNTMKNLIKNYILTVLRPTFRSLNERMQIDAQQSEEQIADISSQVEDLQDTIYEQDNKISSIESYDLDDIDYRLYRLEKSLGDLIEDKLEELLEDKLEDLLEDKLEDKLEDLLEDKLEDKLEDLLEDKLEERFETVSDEILTHIKTENDKLVQPIINDSNDVEILRNDLFDMDDELIESSVTPSDYQTLKDEIYSDVIAEIKQVFKSL